MDDDERDMRRGAQEVPRATQPARRSLVVLSIDGSGLVVSMHAPSQHVGHQTIVMGGWLNEGSSEDI
jgi:hypothetical protein